MGQEADPGYSLGDLGAPEIWGWLWIGGTIGLSDWEASSLSPVSSVHLSLLISGSPVHRYWDCSWDLEARMGSVGKQRR